MSRHKVVLYNPKAVFFDMPLALIALASALDQQKYEVVIIDGRLEENPLEKVKAECADALCLGVTVLTGKPTLDALEITRAVKSDQAELPVVWGGWHTSLFPTETLEQEPSINITVQGQGELTFCEILDALSTGKREMTDIKGCCYRTAGGEIKKNPARPLEDMNKLPKANYDFIDVEAYFRLKGRRQFDYISSTGCYYRCAFCADPFVFNRSFTAIEPERMGEELAAHFERYQFEDLNFQDETFFTYRKRVLGVAEQFIQRGIKSSWAGTMRADQGFRMEDEDFALCAKSGLRRVLIGVESGSQAMMDWLKKDIKLEQVYECARRCKKHGIAVIFPFIVGFPGETEESVDNSLRTIKKLRSMNPDFTTPIFYYKPYPGSGITDEVVKSGYDLPQTLEEWGEFDYIGSSGPWVDDNKYQLIERFKFYEKAAWSRSGMLFKPVQKMARWRMRGNRFGWPIEKKVYETFTSKQRLS